MSSLLRLLILKDYATFAEFFEEMLSLVFNLTSERISERMWKTLPLLYDLFTKDNTEYFTGEDTVKLDMFANVLLC